jgi:hydroxymethylglutaryl-CoA lyase
MKNNLGRGDQKMKEFKTLLPSFIELVEVGPRDGLQSVSQIVSTDEKVQMIEAIVDCGFKTIEAVSFAHPKVLPQMADAEKVMSRIKRKPGVVYRGLVPNAYGAQRAAACGVDEMVALISCDEELNMKNQGMSIADNIKQIASLKQIANGNKTPVTAGIAAAFFTYGKGPTQKETVSKIVSHLIDNGINTFYLASSYGMADPNQVYNTISYLYDQFPDVQIGLHLHNRNGMALANAVAGMMAGVYWLEGSVLGLGGDLWFPGNAEILGNVPMEDLINLTECMGIKTGLDLNKYLAASHSIEQILGRNSYSFVQRGGTRDELATKRWEG